VGGGTRPKKEGPEPRSTLPVRQERGVANKGGYPPKKTRGESQKNPSVGEKQGGRGARWKKFQVCSSEESSRGCDGLPKNTHRVGTGGKAPGQVNVEDTGN